MKLLPATKPYMELLHWSKLKKEIDFDFYAMGAMLERNWMKANQDQRHVVTRYDVHGFNHKVCKNKKYHDPSEKMYLYLVWPQVEMLPYTEVPKEYKNTEWIQQRLTIINAHSGEPLFIIIIIM